MLAEISLVSDSVFLSIHRIPFKSSSSTRLYLKNILIVLWPEAFMITVGLFPALRKLDIATGNNLFMCFKVLFQLL